MRGEDHRICCLYNEMRVFRHSKWGQSIEMRRESDRSIDQSRAGREGKDWLKAAGSRRLFELFPALLCSTLLYRKQSMCSSSSSSVENLCYMDSDHFHPLIRDIVLAIAHDLRGCPLHLLLHNHTSHNNSTDILAQAIKYEQSRPYA